MKLLLAARILSILITAPAHVAVCRNNTEVHQILSESAHQGRALQGPLGQVREVRYDGGHTVKVSDRDGGLQHEG
ncbi:hypothetical protein KZ810_14245 [Sphingomonas sp. RHCKR47]|uniref:hypothetical protein n=1 Tax=Sphingomonas citricola TaxID=2862498 RepID=UPI001CA5127C|nr:hypothetical protein [Sphingomonas citricola]MBW6524661.1 hypothetical protein [Sphingomonas citricola]